MRILIKNGHVIDPAAKVNSQQDLLVEDGRVAAVGPAAREAESRAEQGIDAVGYHAGMGDEQRAGSSAPASLTSTCTKTR